MYQGRTRISGINIGENIRDVEKSHEVMLPNEQQYYTGVAALRNGAISQT